MTSYSFDIIAKTGQLNLVGMEDSPSINDVGMVAFVGQLTTSSTGNENIFAGSGGLESLVKVSTSGSTINFSRGVQINNANQIVGQFTFPSAGAGPVSVVSVWDADSPGAAPEKIADGGQEVNFPLPPLYNFDLVAAIPSINNNGKVVFPALDGSTGLLATKSSFGFGFNTTVNRSPARPMVADNGQIVVRDGGTGLQVIQLYDSNLSSPATVADSQFQSLGLSPGISDDGKAITFYGDLKAELATSLGTTPGAGIFASINTPTGRIIQRIAGISGNGYLDPGETWNDANNNNLLEVGEDIGLFSNFGVNSRVGVASSLVDGAGKTTLAFIGFDTSGKEGIYTTELNLSVGSPVRIAAATKVIEVGDTISDAGVVQDVEISDPINQGGQIAFWLKTEAGSQAIVRATPDAGSQLEVSIESSADVIGIGPDASISVAANSRAANASNAANAEQLSYTVSVTNKSGTDLTGTVLKVNLPAGTEQEAGFKIDIDKLPPNARVDPNNKNILLIEVGSLTKNDVFTMLITGVMTGFSQPVEQLQNYLWDVEASVSAEANQAGNTIASNRVDKTIQVDSSRGLAEILVQKLFQKGSQTSVSEIAGAGANQISAEYQKLGLSYVSELAGIAQGPVKDLDNFRRYSLQISNPEVAADLLKLSPTPRNLSLGIEQTKQLTDQTIETAKEIPVRVVQDVRDSFFNLMRQEIANYAIVAGFLKRFEDFGYDQSTGRFSYEANVPESGLRFNIGVNAGKISDYSSAALAAVRQRNINPFTNELSGNLQNTSADVSASFQTGGSTVSSTVEYDGSRNTGTAALNINKRFNLFDVNAGVKDTSLGISGSGQFTPGQKLLWRVGTTLSTSVGSPPRTQNNRIRSNSSEVTSANRSDSSLFAVEAASDAAGSSIERASASAEGLQGNSFSTRSILSDNGNLIAFNSAATNLTVGDSNNHLDVFLRDIEANTVERVSLANSGTQGNGESEVFGITDDGRYVLFASEASNLTADDTNQVRDLFVRDRQTNTTKRVSLSSSGTQSNDVSDLGAISADGRYVVFSSIASNLTNSDTNSQVDVFVRDLQTNVTERISVSSSGTQGNGDSISSGATISADGRYVVFYSDAANFVANDTNDRLDIFLRDRQAGETIRISQTAGGIQGNGASFSPSISADGRYVVFTSLASNLVDGDTNETGDIFLYDRQTAIIQRISLTYDGMEANGNSNQPSISADGNYIAFKSLASNLVHEDTNNVSDIFVYNRLTGKIQRVSTNLSTEGNGDSSQPSISADGQIISFESEASNLATGDTNGVNDIFHTIQLNNAIVVNSTGDQLDADPNDDTPDVDLVIPGVQVTLRSAIDFANARDGKDLINFNISTGDAGYNATSGSFRIQPTAALPTITDAIIIDGTTQPGYVGKPIINLDGTKTVALNTSGINGLTITAGNSTVRSLVVNNFKLGHGIALSDQGGNVIEGNFIGTNVQGTGVAGNGNGDYAPLDSAGIFIDSSSSNNTIGGTSATTRNIVSGHGIGASIAGNNNTILGNYIGTDFTGTVALGNSARTYGNDFTGIDWTPGIGLLISGSNNVVGGISAAARNLITASRAFVRQSDLFGGEFYGEGANVKLEGSNNQLLGNYIGIDITGTVSLSNTRTTTGLSISGQGNIIGGTTPGAGNIISGNAYSFQSFENEPVSAGGNGVLINASNTVFQGNLVGVAKDGVTPLGNGGDGVYVGGPENQLIGGDLASAGNIIAFNKGEGLNVTSSNSTIANNTIFSNEKNGIVVTGTSDRNTILSNRIFSNGKLGIDLGDNGVTTNDSGDTDTGPNGFQNFPTLTSVTSGSNTTNIEGILSVNRANANYRVDLFSNSSVDPSGFGEGETFLGSVVVTSDNIGTANFVTTLATSLSAGRFITTTATEIDRYGKYVNTSEFSNAIPVSVATGPEVKINDVSKLEGNSSTTAFTFTVSLSQASSQTVTVDVQTTNGTARIADGDYQSLPLTKLTFAPGQISKTVTVQVNGDVTPEADETFFVRLKNAINATITDSQGVGTIQTDETLATTIVVNSTADDSDADPSDGVPDADLGTPGLQTTLRAAIDFANSTPGLNTITFNLPATNAPIIRPNAALPEIYDTVVIDGTTQPGFSVTPIVTLDGSNLAGENGLVISAGNSTVRGLIIQKFQGEYRTGAAILLKENGGNRIEGNLIQENAQNTWTAALRIENTSDNIIGGIIPAQRNIFYNNSGYSDYFYGHIYITGVRASRNIIQGNFIGLEPTGTSAPGGTSTAYAGVHIVNGASNNLIGGTIAGARNIIAGNGRGVSLEGGTKNIVQGNYIGTDVTGSRTPNTYGNGTGVWISSSEHSIGGTQPGAGNVISGNGMGIYIRSDGKNAVDNIIQGNLIGTAADGITPLGNTNGILIQQGSGFFAGTKLNTLIGGTANGAGNIIAYNGDPVNVGNPNYGQTPAIQISAFGNSVLGNSIFSNYGHGVQISSEGSNRIQSNQIFSNSLLGIDLTPLGQQGSGGVTPNDVGDGDAGGNQVQNFPIITGVTSNSNSTNLRGRLNGTGNKTFTIEFFSNSERDPSGYGEGKTLLGRTTVKTDLAGDATFNITLPALVSTGQYITATTTDPDGNTSEFSQGFLVSNSSVPSLSINDASIAEGNSVPNNLNFTVTLSAASTQPVTVQYITKAGSAIADSDYQSKFGTITFNAGETTKIIGVPIIGDLLDENDETFSVLLSNLNNATLNKETGIGKIIDDDDPGLSIDSPSVVEGNKVVFNVTLSKASSDTITVDYADTQGTAIAYSDYYYPGSGQLTFAPGETSKTIEYDTYDDSETELPENFSITLSNPINAVIGTAISAATIIDNDLLPGTTPTLSISNQTVSESNSTATFTVTLSAVSNQPVAVNYATSNGTATSGADYTAVSGTLNFAVGQFSKTITVPILDDTLDEADEIFNVVFSNPVNAVLGTAIGTATIIDNDLLPGTTPTLSISNQTVSERNGTVTFTVTLSEVSNQPVAVNYATSSGTATSEADYTAVSGTLNFAAGQFSKTITVPILDDTLDEADEIFNVVFSNPVNAVLGTAIGTATIIDNDLLPGTTPTLSISNQTVSERNGTATFTVTLSAVSNQPVAVNYATSNGTATSGADYTAVSGTLNFAVGQFSKTITVPILDDTLDEADEIFNVVFSNPANAQIEVATATGTIVDDDEPAPVLPIISINDVSISEGNAGTQNASFTVSLNSISSNTITVNYATANGIAISGSDYAATNGVLTFLSGETSKILNIQVIGDINVEANETFLVNLSSATNATIADSQGIGTIIDGDSTPQILTGETGTALPPINFKGGKRGLTLKGTKKANVLKGSKNNDQIKGLNGNDRVLGANGNDRLFGDSGNDRINAGNGNDQLNGGTGNDNLDGGNDNDLLLGGDGIDILLGGAGDDILIGGISSDRSTGGAGKDSFAFNSLVESGDTITDFDISNDLIDLRAIFTNPVFNGTSRFAQFTQFVQLVQVGASTEVRVDIDGNGVSTAFNTLVTLQNVSASAVSSRSFVIS